MLFRSRGNKGNEGQLHVKDDNIHFLNDFELIGDDIESTVRAAALRK